MEFTRYNSIKGAHTKFAQYVIGDEKDGGEWVATLKIHGANYSYWYDGGDKVVRARRSGFLGESGSFYGDHSIDYDDKVIEIYEIVQGDTVTVFGEIFGGIYPHPDVKRTNGANVVQHEVYYAPFNDFIVFDIKVDDKFLPWDDVVELCGMVGFLVVPELGRGTFDEMMDFDPVFPDPLHQLYNLPPIEGNMAEGVVIKPVEATFLPSGDRVIMKKKNSKFLEVKKTRKRKSSVELTEEEQSVLDAISEYITEQRLRNVLSHVGPTSREEFKTILETFYDDVMTDYEYDSDALDFLSDKGVKSVIRIVRRRCAGLISKNLEGIETGTF